MDNSSLLKFSVDLGEVMLCAGAETFRVEDTIQRLLSVGYDRRPDVFVTPTGIFATIIDKDNKPITIVKRVKGKSSNLYKLVEANSISRDFAEGKISFNKALERLKAIDKIGGYKSPTKIMAFGIISGAFAIMMESSITDSLIAALVGIVVGISVTIFRRLRSQELFAGFIGGIAMGLLGMVFVKIGIVSDLNNVLIGTLMPLVPGVCITSAIRDLMEGDYVSGVSRMMEAVLIAVFIAGGVLSILITIGGLI